MTCLWLAGDTMWTLLGISRLVKRCTRFVMFTSSRSNRGLGATGVATIAVRWYVRTERHIREIDRVQPVLSIFELQLRH